jgi:AraC-like DNA-binding protein
MRPEGFVESYFEAWNSGDAEAIADHLTSNGTYLDISTNTVFDREGLIADLSTFSRERIRYDLLGEALYGESTIAFQYRATSVDDDGNDVVGSTWYGAEFMTVNDEAALQIADYFEIASGATRRGRAADSDPGESIATKYARSGLGEEQMAAYKAQLGELMDEQQVFLHSELTLPSLAELMDCSVNHLSQVINAGFGSSFYDYLNHYRIEEAKQILGDDGNASQAILDIPFAVGFNTNSAFYSAFKKSTGQTPAQYRRKQLKAVAKD